jgi:uncharacterized protein (UPF0335 family)
MSKANELISTNQVSFVAYLIGGTLAFFYGGYKFIEKEKNKIAEKCNEILSIANASSIKVNALEGKIELIKQDNKRVEELMTSKFASLTELVTTKIDHYEKTNDAQRKFFSDGLDDIKELLRNERK